MLMQLWQKLRRKVKGYKCAIFNICYFFVAGFAFLLPDLISLFMYTDISPLVPVKYAPYTGIVLGLINMAIRKYGTTTPMFQGEDE